MLGTLLRLYWYRTENAVTTKVTDAAVEWLNHQGSVAESAITVSIARSQKPL